MAIEQFDKIQNRIVKKVRLGRIDATSSVIDLSNNLEDLSAAWWQSFLRGSSVYADLEGQDSLRIVDAFCGGGGLSLGACLAAISCNLKPSINAAIDVDPGALSVYARNLHPSVQIPGNVDSLVDFHVLRSDTSASFAYAPEVIDSRLTQFVGSTDLFLAGPPCQGHSNFNNKTRHDDPRNQLYLSAVALAIALESKAIVIENVPEVTADKGSVVDTAISLLESSGYSFKSSTVLAAHELGTAQTRKRFFLVASKNPLVMSLEEIKVALRRPTSPVSWAIEDLVDIAASSIFDESPVLSSDNLRRIEWLFKNGEYNLPDIERPDCHKNGNTYPSVYGRLKWDAPAGTITTGFMTPGRGRYIHPTRPRTLTPHEAARLQCFPDTYSFFPNDTATTSRAQLSKLIGDAVPPIMGYSASLAAIASIQL